MGSVVRLPAGERDVVRHCTLIPDDHTPIAAKRSAFNRLGYALLLYAVRTASWNPARDRPPPWSPSASRLPRASRRHPATAERRGAIVVWDFILDQVTRHPRDPRAPEALHWQIHVGHYGQGHNQSGRRASQLLKSHYGNSSWAKQNPVYYDQPLTPLESPV